MRSGTGDKSPSPAQHIPDINSEATTHVKALKRKVGGKKSFFSSPPTLDGVVQTKLAKGLKLSLELSWLQVPSFSSVTEV